MTIRARVTFWFAGVLFVSLMAMGVMCYYELVVEPRRDALRPTALREKESENEEIADIIGIIAWCGLPSLALALGGGWWLMRKAFAPVATLTRAAERINEHNLSERLPRTGDGDELDRLTEVFNAMTERLDRSFQRIREFTLHASHELKTPLTVMHGELETALSEEGLASQARHRLESELDEVQRLTKIVDGLTLLTKADAGQISLAREPVRLDELLSEACTDAQSLARANEIEVKVTASDKLTVMGDRHRLRQLLLNLTDNAVKYNTSKGLITLCLRQADGNAEIVITNSGKGIGAEILPRIFDPFFRGDSSHSHEVEGCGLGLSIARWIANAHGGNIQITSTPGKLTTATVRLPLANLPA